MHSTFRPISDIREPELAAPKRPVVSEPWPAQATQPAECEVNSARDRPVRRSWAEPLERVFDIYMQHCPNGGGGELKIITASGCQGHATGRQAQRQTQGRGSAARGVRAALWTFA
jgi:hypothetical protein